jgi:hypothetical protein
MCDLGDLDSGTATILQLYGNRTTIDRLCENAGILDRERTAPRLLTAYAWEIAREMPTAEQGVLLGMGLLHRSYEAVNLSRHIAHWAIGDFAEGGYMEPHGNALTKDGLTPSPRNMRRLMAPAWIRRHAKRNSETARIRRNTEHHLACAGQEPWREISFERGRWEEMFDVLHQRQRAEEDRMWREARIAMDAGVSAAAALGVRKNKREIKTKIRRHRKIIRRAASAAELVLGADGVRAFIKGNLIIRGQDIDFKVKPASSNGRIGHGGLDLAVLDKKGVKLVDLCLYYKDTPAIEQAASLALEVAAGDERAVLETANVINATQEGANHPVLAERAAKRAAARTAEAGEVAQFHVCPLGGSEWERNLRDARNDAYWEATKSIWIDAVRTEVFGRLAKRLPIITNRDVLTEVGD